MQDLPPRVISVVKHITLNHKTIRWAGGTMAYCLAKSLNSAAWDLMSRIGPKKTAEFAHLCGIKSTIPIVPSIALGSADIQLYEMLRAYSMFPNRGFNTEPIIITRIEDKNGNVIQTFQSESKQVISEVDAYTMYKMMQGVVDFGTGHSMRGTYNINSEMGGKTGTTNDNTDGWFIGYTPQLIAGAWVGCDDPFLHLRNGWTNGGNDMAMPEWAYFMQKVYADKKLGIDPKAQFQKPAELNNDPIYADQNFNAIVKEGQGNDDQGNGDASDYQSNETPDVPVESDFDKNKKNGDAGTIYKKEATPSGIDTKKDTSKITDKSTDKKPAAKEPAIKTSKPSSDY